MYTCILNILSMSDKALNFAVSVFARYFNVFSSKRADNEVLT